MKKIMTLACSALLALGLCACDDTEVEEVPGGDDGTTETVPDTKTDDTTIHPGYVICGDLAGTTSWNNEPDKTSDFYLSTANGETHWERTITGLAEDNGYCGFRVLTYGEWDSVCGASELTSDSTGVSTGSNDILITDGVTYDLVIDISDTAKSIKVTEVVDVEPTSGYEITYAEEQTAVSAADSKMYYWVDEGENHVDPVDGENYYDDGVYHIAYTVEEGVTPLWYGVQLFMELSAEDKAVANLTTGDEYTVSFTISSTISGSITVNGNEVAIEAGETTVNVKSTTTIEQLGGYWAVDESYTDGGYWVEENYATLRVQLGAEEGDFLGAATIEISDLTFAKVLPSEGAVTVQGCENETAVVGYADSTMYFWNDNGMTVTTHEYYLDEDKYVFEYSGAHEWYGFQLFMQLSSEDLTALEVSTGDYVEVSLTITSSVSGGVTICGETVELTADTPYDFVGVSSVSTTNALFSLQGGVLNGSYFEGTTLTITGLSFEKYEMPNVYAYSYSVDFFTLTLSTQADGEEQDSYGDKKGVLCRWAIESNWGASAGGITSITDSIDNTNKYYTCTVTIPAGEVSYAYQLFYHVTDDVTFPTGTSYSVRITIDVSTDVTCTINGVSTELKAGTQTVTVISNHVESSTAGDFQFVIGGGSSDLSLTLKLSEITFLWD